MCPNHREKAIENQPQENIENEVRVQLKYIMPVAELRDSFLVKNKNKTDYKNKDKRE